MNILWTCRVGNGRMDQPIDIAIPGDRVVAAKGWGEGNGWRKTPTGWQWSSEQDSCQSIR